MLLSVDIPRVTQTLDSSKTKLPFALLRRQFPPRLAWVLTAVFWSSVFGMGHRSPIGLPSFPTSRARSI